MLHCILSEFITDELKLTESESSKKLPLLYAMAKKPDLISSGSAPATRMLPPSHTALQKKEAEFDARARNGDVVMREPMMFSSGGANLQ